MRTLFFAVLSFSVALSITNANSFMSQNENVPLLAAESLDIPTTDINPADTLTPARLPDEIKPLESDDPNLKPFLGVWRGQWEGTLDTYFLSPKPMARG